MDPCLPSCAGVKPKVWFHGSNGTVEDLEKSQISQTKCALSSQAIHHLTHDDDYGPGTCILARSGATLYCHRIVASPHVWLVMAGRGQCNATQVESAILLSVASCRCSKPLLLSKHGAGSLVRGHPDTEATFGSPDPDPEPTLTYVACLVCRYAIPEAKDTGAGKVIQDYQKWSRVNQWARQ